MSALASVLLTAVLAVAFIYAVIAAAIAAYIVNRIVGGFLRARSAERRLDALRERHYAEVAARAGQPASEFDSLAAELEAWPVLNAEPPVVFPRRRAA